MPILIREPHAADVRCTDNKLFITLTDGREISAPLSWFPLLERASERQRRQWELFDDGTAIRWEEIDEDISVLGLLGLPD